MKLMEKARQRARATGSRRSRRTRTHSAASSSSRGASATCTAKDVDEPAKAMPYYERALSLIEPIAAANRDDAELQRARAFVLGSIADLQNDLQRPGEGLANYQRALDILEPLRAADPDDQLAPLAVAFMLNGRGSSHLLLGDAAAALHDFSRAETIVRNGPPPQPTDIAEIRMLPGRTYANLARATAAMSHQSSTPKHLRANYVREARDWSRRAHECPATASWRRARRPAREARHHRDERSHCCASSRLPKIRIWIRGLSLSIWNIRAKPN